MSTGGWTALGLALLLGLWALGAHNRLTGLRNRLVEALQGVAEQQRRRGDELRALLEALREPLHDEAAALEAARQAQDELDAALGALLGRPGAADRAAALVRAEQKLAAAQARVVSLAEHARAEAAGPPLEALRQRDAALALARQAFNEAGEQHDQAAEAWPTRLLVPLFGLRPAGRL